MRIKRFIPLLLLLVPVLGSASEIRPYSAKYDVKYDGFKVGELIQHLKDSVDGLQTLKTRAYTTGLTALLKSDTVTEVSAWKWENGRHMPIRYSYNHRGGGEDETERFEFDWQKGQIQSLHKGQHKVLPLQEHTLDKHMYQIVLRQDLRSELKSLSYSVADRGKLREYSFQVIGEERLQSTALGAINCLKVKKGSTTIWAAKQYDYLPIKIEQNEDGTTISTELVEFREA